MPQNIVPNAPLAQVRDAAKERAQFSALKRSLDNITSWELVGASWDEGIVMKFSENFPEEKAKLFLQILG